MVTFEGATLTKADGEEITFSDLGALESYFNGTINFDEIDGSNGLQLG